MLPVFAQPSVDLNSNMLIEVKGYEILANSIALQFSSLNLLRAQQKIERQQHEKTLPAI
jgi:hypothetical protein